MRPSADLPAAPIPLPGESKPAAFRRGSAPAGAGGPAHRARARMPPYRWGESYRLAPRTPLAPPGEYSGPDLRAAADYDSPIGRWSGRRAGPDPCAPGRRRARPGARTPSPPAPHGPSGPRPAAERPTRRDASHRSSGHWSLPPGGRKGHPRTMTLLVADRTATDLPLPVTRWLEVAWPDRADQVETITLAGPVRLRRGRLRLRGDTTMRFRLGHGYVSDIRMGMGPITAMRGLDALVDGTGITVVGGRPSTGLEIDQGTFLALWCQSLLFPASWAALPGMRWTPVGPGRGARRPPVPRQHRDRDAPLRLRTARRSPSPSRRTATARSVARSSAGGSEYLDWHWRDGLVLPTRLRVQWADETGAVARAAGRVDRPERTDRSPRGPRPRGHRHRDPRGLTRQSCPASAPTGPGRTACGRALRIAPDRTRPHHGAAGTPPLGLPPAGPSSRSVQGVRGRTVPKVISGVRGVHRAHRYAEDLSCPVVRPARYCTGQSGPRSPASSSRESCSRARPSPPPADRPIPAPTPSTRPRARLPPATCWPTTRTAARARCRSQSSGRARSVGRHARHRDRRRLHVHAGAQLLRAGHHVLRGHERRQDEAGRDHDQRRERPGRADRQRRRRHGRRGHGDDVTSQLLGNDTDPDNDTLTVTSVSNEAGGDADLIGTTVTFTPPADVCGDDLATLRLRDLRRQRRHATARRPPSTSPASTTTRSRSTTTPRAPRTPTSTIAASDAARQRHGRGQRPRRPDGHRRLQRRRRHRLARQRHDHLHARRRRVRRRRGHLRLHGRGRRRRLRHRHGHHRPHLRQRAAGRERRHAQRHRGHGRHRHRGRPHRQRHRRRRRQR